MDSDPRGRRLELMRAGVQARVARLADAADTAGEHARRWSAPVLLGVLCGGAFSPLVLSGVGGAALLAAGTGAAASVGGNVLTDVVKAGVERLGERHEQHGEGEEFSQEEVEAELARGIERVLEAGGREAEALRGEIAVVLEEIGAVGAAVQAAVRSGNEVLLERLTEGLSEVGRDFHEFGFVLADVRAQLVLLRDDVDAQGGQVRVAVDLLYRQATQIRMLLDQVSQFNTQNRSAAEDDSPAPETGWEGCPYRGLVPFGEGESAVFYGRERVTARLVTDVSRRLTSPGLVVVTGASGAGKSSLLSAGLLPAIGRGELRESAAQWPRHLIKTPTGRPLERLASVLAPMAGLDAATVHAGLSEDPERAHLLVRQAVEGDARRRGLDAAAAGECRLVLVVDQFEELFTAAGRQNGEGEGDEAGEVAAFIAALHAAATRPCGPADTPAALVMIAVRGDFLDRCAAHPLLAGALQDGQFVLGPMNESDLRLTITGPAAAAGLELEPGLIDAIMTDLASSADGQGPGALPLVSQTMKTVWEDKENGNRLTLHGYAQTGGVTQAVATSANRAYTALPDRARDTARRVLVQLVAVTSSGQLVRRTATRTDLLHAVDSPDHAVFDQALDALAAGRLITIDTGTVQISHDVLLEAWPKLRGWLQPDLGSHALRAQLLHDAQEWASNNQLPSYLYRDQRLAAVQDARARWDTDPDRYPALPTTAAAFLVESQIAHTRSVRIRQAATAALSVLLVIAIAAASLAVRAQRNAVDQRDAAVSRQLVSQSQSTLTTDPALASLLAAAAWRIQKSPETRANLLDILGQPARAVLPGSVRSVAFSPNGRTVAAGTSNDSSVRLWDVATHRQLGVPFTGHTGRVNSVAFSPDGRTLASASDDGSVRLWDVATHRQLGLPLTGHLSEVSWVVFSPDGRTLASIGDSVSVRLWDVATRHQIGRLPADNAAAVVFSPNGRTLATSSAVAPVQLWDLATRRRIATLPTDAFASAVTFSPDGHTLATGSLSGPVRLWDVTTRRPVGAPFTGYVEFVTSVAFSPDGRTLAAGGDDGPVQMWDVATHGQIGEPLDNHASVTSVAFSPDGHTLAVGGAVSGTRLWDVTTHREIGAPLTGHTSNVASVAFSPDGRTLASGSDDGTVRLWNMTTRREQNAPLEGHTGPVYSVAFSPDRRVLASSGSTDGTVRLWDLTKQTSVPLDAHFDGPTSVAFSPDGRTLACGSDDGTVRLWEVATRRQIGTPLTGHTRQPGGVISVAFSPQGRTLASSGFDGTVRLWDVATRRQIGTPLTGHTGAVYTVAFNPQGHTLASGSDDRTVRLWDAATRRQIGTPLTGHTGAVASVAFSPDGRTLASGGNDRTVRLWDVATRRQIGTPLTGHTDGVMSAAYSPDGRTLATGGADLTVRLWDVAVPTDLVGSVCTAAGRSLTRQEWARYVPRGPEYRQVCP
ncbi:hypothetical protein GCM10010402_08260 [Actinomadura luteofluorescens]|uniref:nSTAND1 domain-containing NTPase n=1 Tax=Actinomadura luteofluorescens TaxID=46163 RepID=UPI0031CDBEF3